MRRYPGCCRLPAVLAGTVVNPDAAPRARRGTPRCSSEEGPRYALGVEYCGLRYRGWQRQRGAATVEAQLTRCLSAVAAAPLRVQGSGRTDAGVHATGQVAHFNSCARRSRREWMLGANARLPEDIRVLWVREVPADFHARYSPLWRRYRYLVHNAQSRSALHTGRLTWEPRPLALEALRAAARHLPGRHDFTSFRARSCQALNPERTLHELQVRQSGELLVIDLRADAFLQRMVRNIAGVLLEVGLGRRPSGWAAEVLAARDRECAACTAPADGLYLTEVRYPARFQLPRAAPRPLWPAPTLEPMKGPDAE